MGSLQRRHNRDLINERIPQVAPVDRIVEPRSTGEVYTRPPSLEILLRQVIANHLDEDRQGRTEQNASSAIRYCYSVRMYTMHK